MCAAQTYTPHSPMESGPDGSGYYTNKTLGTYPMMEICKPVLLKYIKSIDVKPGEVFTIMDYGCADGGTSMPLLYACVQELRKIYGPKLPIHVTYEDQPVNDFKALFLFLQGLIPGHKSYYMDFPNVFVTACGTNFFSQCVPSGTVKLGFSCTAMHWLSRLPCDITGAVHQKYISEPGEAEKFKEQAEKDWETILLNRAEELAPGAAMVLTTSATDDEGQFMGNTKNAKVSAVRFMGELWQGMVNDGTITQDELHRTNIQNYWKTLKEFKKPFESEDSPVRKAGLSLVSIEIKLVRCPYHEKWMKDGGDPQAHAVWYVGTFRSWSTNIFKSGLSDSRSPEEKTKIVEEYFRRFEEEVAKNPADHALDYVHAFVVIEKSK